MYFRKRFDGSRPVLEELKSTALNISPCAKAGFNNVDLDAAKELGLKVVRVPAYDPEAVAEHAIGMMMTLNRRIHRAYQRTQTPTSLEGLTGFTIKRQKRQALSVPVKSVWRCCAFWKGLVCVCWRSIRIRAAALEPVRSMSICQPCSLNRRYLLHCPLTPGKLHLLKSKPSRTDENGVMIVNTSRGALIDSQAAIEALKKSENWFVGYGRV